MTTRICELCASADQEHIHRQHFLFPGLVSPVHYDVLACRACGFAFASDIPDQSELNQFYEASEHHLHSALPAGLQRIHANFFRFVREHAELTPDVRILDIGSGMGHFLHHFQQAGFARLLGMEPSPAAATLAFDTYGIGISTATVDTFDTRERFGLVSLCGVLEHIGDLRSSMTRIARLVEDEGYLFIAVPDAAAFGQTSSAEPFLEFALEHINFFTSVSLDNLLRTSGFEKVAVISQHNDFYDNHYLLAMYRKSASAPIAVARDLLAASSLRTYVDFSRQQLRSVEALATQLERSGEPVVIWGAGALTSRLLCDTPLGRANIRAIVDRNAGLHGKSLLNVSIGAPEKILAYPGATVFIASTTYASEIKNTLLQEYQWSGRILSLAPGATP